MMYQADGGTMMYRAQGDTYDRANMEFIHAAEDPNHDYHTLAKELLAAFWQASGGKGRERHANGLPFDKQRIQTISDGIDSVDGLTYQVCKKMQEAAGLEKSAARHERLGVIVYAAAANVWEDRQ